MTPFLNNQILNEEINPEEIDEGIGRLGVFVPHEVLSILGMFIFLLNIILDGYDILEGIGDINFSSLIIS